MTEVHPWMASLPNSEAFANLRLSSIEDSHDLSGLDLLFLSLPAGESSAFLEALGSGRPVRAVDLGPDFRLPASLFERHYARSHPLAGELDRWVYGFTEALRDKVADSRWVANPGCYAIAALIGLYPLARAGAIEGRVYVDGKSGLSGAGRKAEYRLLLSEGYEDVVAYSVGGHRHLPEIQTILEDVASPVSITFVPHLVPMARGLLVTCCVPVSASLGADELTELYSSAYGSEPFVHVVGEPPHTKAVRGTNAALVHAALQGSDGAKAAVAVVTVAIDNLGKGAAGSAVQNANLMLGLEETTGLQAAALWP